MKLKEKMGNFCILFIILLFIYLLCPTHNKPQGYYSKAKSFCAIPFYIIILFAFIIIFVLH
jgi:hypothetical protein